MDKEKVVCAHLGVPFSHEVEQSHAICEKMDKTREHYVKQIKSDAERQTLHVSLTQN
jgi:hypothetical protein